MENCIFCQIVKKKLKSYTLYEDDYAMSFLDIHPVSGGHLLVIPKEHHDDVFNTPDEILEKLSIVCKKMGELCKEKLGATGINILNASGKDAQQDIFHLHFHIVPRFPEDNLDLWFSQKAKNQKTLEQMYELLKK